MARSVPDENMNDGRKYEIATLSIKSNILIIFTSLVSSRRIKRKDLQRYRFSLGSLHASGAPFPSLDHR